MTALPPRYPGLTLLMQECAYPSSATTSSVDSYASGPTEAVPGGRFWLYAAGAMRDTANELRRIALPRTRVNSATTGVRSWGLVVLVASREAAEHLEDRPEIMPGVEVGDINPAVLST